MSNHNKKLNIKKAQVAFEISINIVSYFLFISMLSANIDTLVNEKIVNNIYQKNAYTIATETELAVQNAKLRKGMIYHINYENLLIEKVNNESLLLNYTYPLAYAKIDENMTIDEFEGKGIVNSWTISRT
ncbi:MAG: hypothetical protein N3E37_01305 [Candidatus Micrarchaeota archaeon]|nr:hypothetical protein [Candidatus Micrarchaeota archaeon]